MTTAQPLHLFTIGLEHPFAQTLARRLLEQAGDDPLALANMRLLLPSRRACRAMQRQFLKLMDGRPLLLPKMQPIGDVDEDELLLSGLFASLKEAEQALPAVMSSAQRLLMLARLVHQFESTRNPATPPRLDQSFRLAEALAQFMDEVAREELGYDRLRELVPEELAQHWQEVLDFLKIITVEWPSILQAMGLQEPIVVRNQLLRALAEHWRRSPPPYPVIAAGTTGSTPATARLLGTIARMPQGQVILPALDLAMPDAAWQAMEESHPQFGMKRLLERISVTRGDVLPYVVDGDPDHAPAPEIQARAQFVHAAMLPAEATATGWHNAGMDAALACRGLHCITTETAEEEARLIALLLREAVETPMKTAALVTPDRQLARRVIATAQRFGLEIDDSAGKPLADVTPGVFLRLVAEAAQGQGAAVPLLALLKHPYTAVGTEGHAVCRRLARLLERYVLRGVRLESGFAAMRDDLLQVRGSSLQAVQRVELEGFISRLQTTLQPLADLFAGKGVPVPLAQWLHVHLEVAQEVASFSDGTSPLWQGEEGEAVALHMQQVMASASLLPQVEDIAYVGILDALLQQGTWRARYGMHPRLQVLSPMEARLQHVDRAILGGMNEGSWPAPSAMDPWMSRPMRSEFGLLQPERQIGLAAHDVVGLLASPEVFLTRTSKESSGAQAVPSRWWMRLRALAELQLGASVAHEMLDGRNRELRNWAARTPPVQESVLPAAGQAAERPAQCPPVQARPQRLSATSFEKLLVNPYEVYAKKILSIFAFDPLGKEPGPAEFGALMHAAIEAYTPRLAEASSEEDAYAILREEGEKVFQAYRHRPAVELFWWGRFERTAAWIAAQDWQRRGEIAEIRSECQGEWTFSTSPQRMFTLEARADRMEILKNKKIRLVDFKTGAEKTPANIRSGFASQLLAEAAIVRAGGFGKPWDVEDLEYWHCKTREGVSNILSFKEIREKQKDVSDGGELAPWIAEVAEAVQRIATRFDNPSTPYYAYPIPTKIPTYDDYAHLARRQEWMLTDDGEET